MATSVKDIDPAFRQGIGRKAGMDVWQIENAHRLILIKPQYGSFCSNRSYIVLKTRALKSGQLQHDIHYWLGSFTNPSDAATAAIKAIELNASLGWHAVQMKEVEGHESDRFLSYFKPCFIPIKQSTSLRERTFHKPRLFKCKGRHLAHVEEVPFARSSLSHDDVFIVDTESRIFQFNGSNTDIYERAKALDVVQYLKEILHKGNCRVAVIEDGPLISGNESGEFWNLFGGFAPIARKQHDKKSAVKATTGTLHIVLEGQPVKLQASPLRRDLLTANKCYILDHGKELFTWFGHDTSLEDKKAAMLAAEDWTAKNKIGGEVKLLCVVEGFEPVEFRSKFDVWPAGNRSQIPEVRRGKIAALVKQAGLNVRSLLRKGPVKDPKEVKELPNLYKSIGKLQVWCINGNSKRILTPREHGKFHNDNCYVVQHTSIADQNKEHFLYSWMGQQSTRETRVTAINHSLEIASSIKETTVEVQIFEGKEPDRFLSHFDKLFVFKDNEKKHGVSLFQVQQTDSLHCHAIQVVKAAASLNSSRCFVLQAGDIFFTWYGKFTKVDEHEATKSMVYFLKPNASLITLKEGSETQLFWDRLGGKQMYPSNPEPKDVEKEPRIFSCIQIEDELKIAEIFDYTQDDLLSDEIMILDCYTSILVWIGHDANSQHKIKAFEIGQKYLYQAARYEGIALEIPIYKIMEGHEPQMFKAYFSWNSKNAKEHLNIFERKLLAVKGGLVQENEMLRYQKCVSLSDNQNFQQTTDSEKPNQPLPIIHENQSETSTYQAKDKIGQESSLNRNIDTLIHPAINKAGYAFPLNKTINTSVLPAPSELPNGRKAPPNTPIVKFTTLTVKAREPIKVSPPESPCFSITPTPVIATMTSAYDSYQDRFTFAWKGTNNKFANRDVYHGEMEDICEEKQTASESISAYPYERLKTSSTDPVFDIDTSKRESYLSDGEFLKVFQMEKDAFYKLPKWKQDMQKKMHELF